jgi:hypothetical protein
MPVPASVCSSTLDLPPFANVPADLESESPALASGAFVDAAPTLVNFDLPGDSRQLDGS